jgi:hypothetical protein
MSDRTFWRWTSVAIVGAALVELAVPGACVPALVAQFWFGLTIGIVSAFWPPPSGPDAVPTLKRRDVPDERNRGPHGDHDGRADRQPVARRRGVPAGVLRVLPPRRAQERSNFGTMCTRLAAGCPPRSAERPTPGTP